MGYLFKFFLVRQTMERIVIARHYVNNEDSCKVYEQGIVRLKGLIKISKEHGNSLKFGLKLTVDRKMDSDLMRRVHSIYLEDNNFFLYDPFGKGPGTSYIQILFGNAHLDNLIGMADLDGYIDDSEACFSGILRIMDLMEEKDGLHGMGVRNIPANLGVYSRNSNLRVFHEAVHSLTIEKILGKSLGIGDNGGSPIYADVGESSTGFSVINPSHKGYLELQKRLFESYNNVRSAGMVMNGFAVDYFVSIAAAQIGEIIRSPIETRKNEYSSSITEKQEFDDWKGRVIEGQTRVLSYTDINMLLLNTISIIDPTQGERIINPETLKRILKHFPESREDVAMVLEWMLNSFHRG